LQAVTNINNSGIVRKYFLKEIFRKSLQTSLDSAIIKTGSLFDGVHG